MLGKVLKCVQLTASKSHSSISPNWMLTSHICMCFRNIPNQRVIDDDKKLSLTVGKYLSPQNSLMLTYCTRR